MYDLVVRGGTLVDGTGAAPVVADVAIQDGVVAEIGQVSENGREEIDARGKIVTPGFVDIHTHYDGQATWDPLLTPTSWHGVTTLVMGNCGVGFAPVAPDKKDFLLPKSISWTRRERMSGGSRSRAGTILPRRGPRRETSSPLTASKMARFSCSSSVRTGPGSRG